MSKDFDKSFKKILMSGGSGLLGSALRKIDGNIIAPSHAKMDVLNPVAIERQITAHQPDIFLHAAAFTSPPRCNENPTEALRVNIGGTVNVVDVCAKHNIKLIYISTDYVFKGDKGNYKEDDELYPQNLYAWTKLGGECAVRTYDNSLIIRTSFSPEEFPYEAAFVDQYTSRDAVSIISRMIYDIIHMDIKEVLHVGTERKTVKELAQKLGKKDVKDLYRNQVSFSAPQDTSFNLEKLNTIYDRGK